MAEWKAGDRIKLVKCNFSETEVVRILGEGGQGTVYEVKVGGVSHALKWYHLGKLKNKEAFRENLRSNIVVEDRNMGSCPKFLWPKYLTEEKKNSFGYIMNLRPKDFTDFPAILNAKDKNGNKVGFKSTDTMILAALNLVNAFRELHLKGLSYQDLNDGNFFINIKTGDVLICDNDNVTPYGEENPGEVGGKPGYMAPEIVRGEARPATATDYHSLAVVLFKLFFRDNPLQGAEHERVPCLTEDREMQLYGRKPVFIYDPQDNSNRPIPGVHVNVINLWPQFPPFFQEAFIQSFAKGMKHPQERLSDNDWQKMLVRLRDEWMLCCPSCGKAIILTGRNAAGTLQCGGCNSTFSYPKILSTRKSAIPLFPGKKIYACHTMEVSGDYAQITGEVVMNKNNPSLWGIKNLTQETWKLTAADGTEKDAPPQGGVPIGVGVTIDFKGVKGTISEKAE